MKTFNELISDLKKVQEEIANTSSSGAIAGLGFNLGKTEGQPMLSDRPADDLVIRRRLRNVLPKGITGRKLSRRII